MPRLSHGMSLRRDCHATNKYQGVSTKGIIMQSRYSLRSTFILRLLSASRLGPP